MSDTQLGESITIYSDYVCPFCYLGRESLREYQETREQDLAIDWHPFDLQAGRRNPDGSIDHSVDSGKDESYYEQARENVRRLQEQYDVEMADELRKDVDSFVAQVVSFRLSKTEPYEQWLAFDEALFDALWKDGRDIGDVDVLADVASDVGIDPERVRDIATDEEAREAVEAAFDEAQRRGVRGVPTFAYEDHAASGAIPPEHIERLVDG